LAIAEQLSWVRQEDLERIKRFRLMDDVFLTKCFEDDTESTQFVLRIILNKPDLVVLDVHTQVFVANLLNRSVKLDVVATDSEGRKINVEVQREDKGADPHRARFHSSVLDIENLDAGQEFRELPDTFTIFITEKDFYGKGEPVYLIERMNITTGKPFADGEHILYVNGEYRGDSDIGKLMHDFNCTNAADMNFKLLADRTRYLKENPKGVSEMCKVIEDMRNQERKETMMEVAKKLLFDGTLTLEKIAECVGLSLDEVKRLQAGQGT